MSRMGRPAKDDEAAIRTSARKARARSILAQIRVLERAARKPGTPIARRQGINDQLTALRKQLC